MRFISKELLEFTAERVLIELDDVGSRLDVPVIEEDALRVCGVWAVGFGEYDDCGLG
jgi:hypothetical protein